MITFLLIFTLITLLIEFEAYVNYGSIILSKHVFITPVLLGVCAQGLVVVLKFLVEEDKKEKEQ